ncbi:MAG: septum formation inhibitor Maf [Calditrichaceae bacterium]|nr:septum formation inhibitor Maf [Calditrichaceae bacterium]
MLDFLIENYNELDFILASASPRRSELLNNIGLKFKVMVSHVEEDEIRPDNLNNGLINNARKKGEAVAESNKDAVVISADTIVVLDHHIMGKPVDENDACEMLKKLSGRTHEVMTAFGLICKEHNKSYFETIKTKVKFRSLNSDEISAYVEIGEPMDKAGAYAIQGKGSVLVDNIEGCYFNVVGFPISRFFVVLKDFCKGLNDAQNQI